MPKGFAEQSPSKLDSEAETTVLSADLKLGPGGRVVIPAEIRSAMGLKEGDTIIAEFSEGELRLVTIPEQVRRLQEITKKYHPEHVSLVDEFLRERRAMWGEED